MGYYDWHDVGNEAAFADDSDGITVRDYFASRAPQTFDASSPRTAEQAESMAIWAFVYADAMVREKLVLMKERQKADDDRRKRAREKQEASELGRLKKENEVLQKALFDAGFRIVRSQSVDVMTRVEKREDA